MNKPRIWIALSFVLVFAAGMVAGVFGHKWFTAKRMDNRGSSSGRGPVMDFWSKEIGLDEAQMIRLREVFKANDERMRTDIRLKELRAERAKWYEELRRKLQADIDAILTPEQKVKLAATLKRYEEQRRKSAPPNPGRDGRGGGPERAPEQAPRSGPDGPDIRNQRTDFRPPFHEYYSKGVNE
jgi:hypothetical protein